MAMSEEDFFEKYKPIQHPAEGEGIHYFQKFDPDLKFVQGHDPHFVWSAVDGDDGNIYVVPGFCVVNLIYYVITLVPWEDKDLTNIEVLWHESEEEDDDEEE